MALEYALPLRYLACSLLLAFCPGHAAAVSLTEIGDEVFNTLAKAKISLPEAVAIAERVVAGTPVKAGLNDEGSPANYRVYIADVDSHTVTAVRVDARSGAVLSVKTYPVGNLKGRRAKHPSDKK